LIAIDDGTNNPTLGIISDGVNATEQFFLAKRFFLTQVLNHRVRRIADQMLLRAIVVGIKEDKVDELNKIYLYKNNEGYIRNYLYWDDFRFFSFLSSNKLRDKICHDLLSRLANRNLFKRIYRENLDKFCPKARDLLIDINETQYADTKQQIEKIAKELIEKAIGKSPKLSRRIDICSDDYRYWLAHVYKIDSIRIMAKNESREPISVRRNDGSIIPFDEESKLFRSIDDTVQDNVISIYAPIRYQTPSDRDLLIRKVNKPITEAINNLANNRGIDNG